MKLQLAKKCKYSIQLTPEDRELIESFNLTAYEKEVFDRFLRVRRREGRFTHYNRRTYDITNIAIQYIEQKDIENRVGLARNYHLRPEIIRLMLEYEDYVDDAGIYCFLTFNPVVLDDLELFEACLVRGHARNSYLWYYFLEFIIDRGIGNNKDTSRVMSIDIFMATVRYIKSNDNTTDMNGQTAKSLHSIVEKEIELRKEEIREWVDNNMPEFKDLPLSWAIRLIDLRTSLQDLPQ